ncbi:winged helix-turn-helix transcriptional regulator [Phytoactinopolyspora halotolerans]|uniref:Winged helix-turn-helix transcriptional regulator n=2 Tax=Phytoactinopolyspora halotolerans TaxID=1981512 RepID=A0A6L9S482_9ACTN|nr:winged helix-turn-helix transcriptional regulator [Phytoactinopolyspora halotolerans]
MDPASTEFDPRAGEPGYIYLRLANHLAGLIATGELKPGARLPGERDFAFALDVSVGTLRRSMDELCERGLVVKVPAKGTYVAHHVG